MGGYLVYAISLRLSGKPGATAHISSTLTRHLVSFTLIISILIFRPTLLGLSGPACVYSLTPINFPYFHMYVCNSH